MSFCLDLKLYDNGLINICYYMLLPMHEASTSRSLYKERYIINKITVELLLNPGYNELPDITSIDLTECTPIYSVVNEPRCSEHPDMVNLIFCSGPEVHGLL